ncbi:hypothetical protein DPMN_112798 [Dreissena polymorpha]|uniref:Uncharacterized protein n=1 Tax=Dreissena polymorpha TaxID=45954 RepID=A0A9D4QQ77_DREPO|nr:hypothetical protein DPMN_112798 [Dreissena polymorpha]
MFNESNHNLPSMINSNGNSLQYIDITQEEVIYLIKCLQPGNAYGATIQKSSSNQQNFVVLRSAEMRSSLQIHKCSNAPPDGDFEGFLMELLVHKLLSLTIAADKDHNGTLIQHISRERDSHSLLQGQHTR